MMHWKDSKNVFENNNQNNRFKGASVASIQVVGPFKVIVKIITTTLNCCKQSSHAFVMIQKYSF
jgi:hypothetical protein